MLSHIRKLVRQFNQVAGEEDECGQSNDLEAIYQTLFIKLIIWFWFVVIEKEIDLISSDQFYIWSRSLSKQVFNYIATDNTLWCSWGVEIYTHISIHVLPRKHIFNNSKNSETKLQNFSKILKKSYLRRYSGDTVSVLFNSFKQRCSGNIKSFIR